MWGKAHVAILVLKRATWGRRLAFREQQGLIYRMDSRRIMDVMILDYRKD